MMEKSMSCSVSSATYVLNKPVNESLTWAKVSDCDDPTWQSKMHKAEALFEYYNRAELSQF